MRHVLRAALIVATVVVLIVIGTGATLAQPPSPQLEVKGIITAIDKTGTPPTLTITPREGSNITLEIDQSTVIRKAGVCNATIDDLAANDRAVAIYNGDTMVASRVFASPPLKDYHSFVGIIRGKSDDGFNVTTRRGNFTITVNCATKYKVPGVINATLDNFNIGDKVAILAIAVTTDSIVEILALNVNLIPGRPIYILRAGIIEGYQAGANITLRTLRGGNPTFIVTGDTRIVLLFGATEVRVGGRAAVIARRDPATDQFTATAIIVFGPGTPGL